MPNNTSIIRSLVALLSFKNSVLHKFRDRVYVQSTIDIKLLGFIANDDPNQIYYRKVTIVGLSYRNSSLCLSDNNRKTTIQFLCYA